MAKSFLNYFDHALRVTFKLLFGVVQLGLLWTLTFMWALCSTLFSTQKHCWHTKSSKPSSYCIFHDKSHTTPPPASPRDTFMVLFFHLFEKWTPLNIIIPFFSYWLQKRVGWCVWNVCFEECFAIKGGKFKIEALSPPKQKPTHYMKKDLQL